MTKTIKSAAAQQSPADGEGALRAAAAPGGKLGLLVELLARPEGADIKVLGQATGWQAHSVRGALAGALKKRGYNIVSQKTDGRRVYRLAQEG